MQLKPTLTATQVRGLALGAVTALLAVPAAATELVFRDTMERRLETVFRDETLALRDPHVFADIPFVGCVDFTDQPIPGTGFSLNGEIAAALSSDDDGDGLLDLSPLTALDVADPQTIGPMVTRLQGACPTPAPPPSCGTAAPPPAAQPAENQTIGNCLAPVPGTTSGYMPGVATIAAPCFATRAATLTTELNGLSIPLQGARLGATRIDGTAALAPVLTLGFLRESDAEQIPLPDDIPLLGGQPLSSILPGGSGNCAAGDDRDTFEGESGWWVYLESSAVPVDFQPD